MASYMVFDVINKETGKMIRRYMYNSGISETTKKCFIAKIKNLSINMINRDYGGHIPSTYRITPHIEDIKIIQRNGIETYKFIEYTNPEIRIVRFPYYPKLDRYGGHNSGWFRCKD